MARTALLLLFVTALVTGIQRPVGAEDVDALRARDDRIEDLERKLEVVVDELSRLREQVAVPEEPELKSAYGMGPAASKVYGIDRGLSIGGYGEGQYRTFFGDTTNDDLDRADFLRMVLYFGYKFSDRIVFNSEIEFEHATTSNVGNGAGSGSASVELATLDFFLHEKINARAGMLLLPIGFVNEIHEPPFFYGVNRPETETRIIPTTWRENGAGIFGNLTETLSYRAYVVSGFNGQNFSDSGFRSGRQKGNRALTEDFGFVVRGDWRPDAVPGLMLGGSYYTGNSGQDVRVASGERLPEARINMFELHAQYHEGPWKLRALYAYTDLGDTKELNDLLGRPQGKPIAETMMGGYVEAGYDVWPLFDESGTKRLEPFMRIEYVDTQYKVPTTYARNGRNRYWLFTPGINFYPHPNVVLKLEYRNYQTLGGERPQELAVGMGFAF